MPKLDLSYPAILNQFGDYAMKGRKESKAFLAWFLENYYRLDSTEVDDAICDEPGDKGVDGIYVSDLLQQIDVFQSRMGTANPTKSLGDPEMKELLGTITQFKDGKSVKHLAATTPSIHLKRLLERLDIATLVDDGYDVRGVFITNRVRDQHAIDLLAITPQLVLFDGQELERQYLPIDKPEPIGAPISFDVSGVNVLQHSIETNVEMIVAPLLASDLVKMSGLANQELFAWNLRYHLKRTPVNKEIEASIASPTEHKYFPAFHNGLTVLAETLEMKNDKITIQGYAVVNGCQSLSALYQRSANITSELRILTKFVSVSPKSALALKITDHTNRQNGITGRDLQSNNALQTRLQTEVNSQFSGDVFYRIARGEHSEWDASKVIENDEVARILLAFDLKEPESCHQNYKLFDELHARIFGRQEVNAERIVLLSDIDAVVREKLQTMEDRAFAGYSLTPFLFLFLLREVLELPESGGSPLCQSPGTFLSATNGRKRLRYVIGLITGDIINMVVAELKRRKDAGVDFDHKKDLKSPTRIHEIRSQVIPLYQMAANAKFARPFSKAWKESETELLFTS